MKVSYKYTVLFIFLFANFSLFATKYTWTGNTSTDWSTSTNWSPNGVPSTTDSVKIVTRTNAPVVGANTTVKDLDMTSGSISLGGYSLTVSNNAYFYAGTLSNGTLVLRGSYALFNGSTFNVTIDAIAARTEFSGGVFNYPCSFEQTGTSTTNGAGGCTFNAAVTIKKSGASYLTMGVTSADIFNSKLKVINTGTYAIQLGYNTVSAFYDSLIFENSSASGISIGGGNTNGGGHIYNGKKIAIGTGGFSAGLLTLKNFIQTGTGQQAFATSGSAITSLAGCSFEADLTITSPGILLKTSTFNGTTEFIRSSTSSSYSDGGNTFNGTTTFRNNASNTASFRLGVQTGDQYNGNVSFITSTGYIQPAFAGTSEFKGNVSISSSMVVFNAGAGKMLCTGTNNQTFSTSGSLTYLVSKFGVNKSSGTVTFNAPITVDSLLELTSGNIITSSSNLLTLKATATVSGGSSMSFVNGPLKKNGSAAFLYPVGKVNEYNPISLSTGNNVTDSYLVEYFNQGQSLSNNKDTTIKEINSKMYWSCTRISGTSIPSISLFWNEKNSIFAKPSNSKVVAWNNVKWKDKGQTNSSGNALIGSITALFDVTANYYTVGRVNDTTQISEQRLLKDVAVLGLDSINVQMPMQILGSAVSMVYCSNLYATDTIGSQNTLIDSVRNEFVDVFATYKSKTYTSIVVNEGDTISNQGFFKLGKCTYNLGFTISGDTSMKVILKCDSLFKLNNGAKIKLNGIKRSNVIWICEDVSVDSLSEMNGVVFCRTFNSKTYNLGHIQLLSSGKVELNNSIGLNDYVFLRNGVELDRINQNLSLLTTPCNFITNGDLEGGVPTSSIVSLAGITNGYCQNWLSLSSSSAPCATRPDNTPDYFDRNIANSSFNNCYLNVGTGVGIPNNYQSDGVVNVRTPNQNRYMMMLEKEAAANQLASTLRNKIYALSFFYAGSNCLGNTDAACIYLTNLNNNKVQVGNYNYNLGSGTSSSGDWRQAFICVDLHQISNLQQYSHIAFRGNQFTSNLFYDDFALIEIADAGDDKTICSNQSVTIGGNSCPNSIIPNTITTFSWTASPAYNWQNGENLTAQPSVSPSISTLFTLTTTITFTDPLDPSNVTTCSDFDQVFVEVLNLSGSISVNQNPCNAATLLAAATSGTAPFSYQWNTGSTSNSITVSSNGVYTVTISDASGCSTVLTQNVQLSNLATNVTIVNSPCVGQSNGQISVVMQGGVSGYSYSWSNGSVSGSGNSSQATWNITGLNVGNYTLLITDVSGCSASVTFQVVEVPCCSLSVSLIPQQPCSTNQSGAINGALVNGNGPFTVSWQQTPTGLSGSLVTSSSSFTIPNLVPGTYSVQIVDANSCTASGSSTISIISPPSIPVVIGSNSICNSTSSYSISNPATGVAYTWSFVPSYSNAGATLTFSNTTGNATNVTYNDNSNYMLSVVATNANGCTASTFFAVNECCNDGELNVVDGSSSTIPSYYNNFSIDGVFSVDVNTVWNSKTIYMGPGAEIRIQPGKSLTIESSNIIPCRTFWKSITVNYGSLITIDNSIVQGGQYAIDVRAGGGYVIQNNSNLYDNFVSLRVTGPPSSMPRKIEKTNICRAPSGLSLYNSLADFIGQTPSTGNSSTCVARPYAGIVLDFANVNLVGTLMPNRLIVIKDAMYGIWSSNSFLRVLQTHIENILNDPCQPINSNNGNAIFTATNFSTGNAWIGYYGPGTSSNVSIRNCRSGIRTLNLGPIIRNVDIIGVSEGIRAGNIPPHFTGNKTEIRDNKIEFGQFGVRLSATNSIYHAGVYYNTFSDFNNGIGNGSLDGAVVVQTNIVSGSELFISNNDIDLSYVPFGIYLTGASSSGIGSNNIHLNKNAWQRGVFLSGNYDFEVLGNTITGTTSLTPISRYGFFGTGNGTLNLQSNVLRCNHINNCSRDFYLQNVNSGIDFKQNIMEGGRDGLFLSSTLLGWQIDKFNKWCTGFLNASINANIGSTANFKVPTNFTPLPPPINCEYNPLVAGSVLGSAFILPGGSTIDPGCGNLLSQVNGIDEFDRYIVDSLPHLNISEQLKYQYRRFLAGKLILHPEWVSQDSSMNSFWSIYRDSDLVKIASYEAKIGDLKSHDGGKYTLVQNASFELNDILTEIAAIDSVLMNDTLNLNSTFMLLRQIEANRVDSIVLEIDKLMTQGNDFVKSARNEIYSELLNVSFTNPQAIVEKEYLLYQLKHGYWSKEVVNAEDSTLIYSLANLCAEEFGPAVTWARGIYAEWHNEYLNDDDICARSLRLSDIPTSKLEEMDIDLRPNPAKNLVTVKILGNDFVNSLNSTIFVYDIKGKLLTSCKFFGEMYNLDLENFETGIYILKICSEGQFSVYKKLMIVK